MAEPARPWARTAKLRATAIAASLALDTAAAVCLGRPAHAAPPAATDAVVNCTDMDCINSTLSTATAIGTVTFADGTIEVHILPPGTTFDFNSTGRQTTATERAAKKAAVKKAG